jgi:hypothetical protein
METMTGAKALMTAMEKEGVKQVFGLPGGANLPMYDEFARCDIRQDMNNLQHIWLMDLVVLVENLEFVLQLLVLALQIF